MVFQKTIVTSSIESTSSNLIWYCSNNSFLTILQMGPLNKNLCTSVFLNIDKQVCREQRLQLSELIAYVVSATVIHDDHLHIIPLQDGIQASPQQVLDVVVRNNYRIVNHIPKIRPAMSARPW